MATEELAPSTTSDRSGEIEPITVVVPGKVIWQAIGAILFTLVVVQALRAASGVVSMVAISFFFSLALEPPVRRMTKRFEWRRGRAVAVIYLAGVLFVLFMISVLIPALSELAKVVGERGSDWLLGISNWISDVTGVEITTPESAQELAERFDITLTDWADEAFGAVVGLASTGLSLIFTLATVAMFTFYLTADGPRVQHAVLRLFRGEAQQRIGWTWDQAIVQTGGYFYSRMILMFISGIGFFVTMVVVGLPASLAISLALFGSFVSVFIPAIGTYIGGAIPVLISLGLQGLSAGLIVLGYVLVYQQVENYWLSPKISADTMSLNGGVAFGAALAGGAIAGPMGAFTALPVAALISSFVSNYYASHDVEYTSQIDPRSRDVASPESTSARQDEASGGEEPSPEATHGP